MAHLLTAAEYTTERAPTLKLRRPLTHRGRGPRRPATGGYRPGTRRRAVSGPVHPDNGAAQLVRVEKAGQPSGWPAGRIRCPALIRLSTERPVEDRIDGGSEAAPTRRIFGSRFAGRV